MGRPTPGYPVVLVNPVTGEPADEGEICLDLSARPLGLMVGYRDDEEGTTAAMAAGYYHTGDIGSRDADGYITYVGRTDDVFKASDYRISPFELESVLIEHGATSGTRGMAAEKNTGRRQFSWTDFTQEIINAKTLGRLDHTNPEASPSIF